MRTLYIECNMGAAGDMLMAALLELLPDPEQFIEEMNNLGIPDVHISSAPSVKHGITGTQITVCVGGAEEVSHDVPSGHHHHGHEQHHHTGMMDIHAILNGLLVSNKVKSDALAVYGLIAEAESQAHGKPVEVVHFHEVGMMDAVADIVGVCLAVEKLALQRIVVSPVHVGSGQVKCAHGVLPVPAPATAHILQGVPTYGGQIQGELCTPTGAALLKCFADEFGDRPMMVTDGIGYGMGKKDFPILSCVRTFIGETQSQVADIVELVCNLDDMTGEDLGFALEVLRDNGALDVYVVPIQMKKGRSGHMLVCLCEPDDEDKMAHLILRHTSTIGLRSSNWRRYTLERSIKTVQTEYGEVRIKTASGFGVVKSKPEYEDLARIAQRKELTVSEVRKVIETE